MVTWRLHAEPLLQNAVADPGKEPPLSQRYNKMPILVEPRYNEGLRDYENHSSYSVNWQHKFIYEKYIQIQKLVSKYQTPKIQFNRIATAKNRIPELKRPRMCKTPGWA